MRLDVVERRCLFLFLRVNNIAGCPGRSGLTVGRYRYREWMRGHGHTMEYCAVDCEMQCLIVYCISLHCIRCCIYIAQWGYSIHSTIVVDTGMEECSYGNTVVGIQEHRNQECIHEAEEPRHGRCHVITLIPAHPLFIQISEFDESDTADRWQG